MLPTVTRIFPHKVDLSLQNATWAPAEKFHQLETEERVDSKLHLELDAKFQSASLDVLFFTFAVNEVGISFLLTFVKHS